MDEKVVAQKMEENKDVIAPPLKNRDPNDRRELQAAMKSWGETMKAMLDGRFGKGKVGYILILAPIGRESSLSWISDLSFASCKATFEALQQRTKQLDEKSIRLPSEYFGG